jgi:serine protease Do
VSFRKLVASAASFGAGLLFVAAGGVSADPLGLTSEGLAQGRRNAIVRASERVGPAIVTVSILKAQLVEGPAFSPYRDFFDSFFFRNLRRRYWQRVHSIGSGVIVRADGTILTNYHVVQGAEEIKITLADGREYPAQLLGEEELYDLAVLKAATDGAEIPVAPLDSTGSLYVGEWVIAIGNPFGYLLGDAHPTVTVGVVSATKRDILPEQENQDTLYKDMIQTDAAINPGNSGGALANALGEVVGINTFIFSRSGGSHGIGFAIPIETARRVMNEILEHGKVREVWVGIHVQEIPAVLAESLELESTDGVIVASVEEGSPADRAGLRRGDVITKIGDERIRNFEDARRALYGLLVGDRMNLAIRRGERELRELTLQLTERK